MNYYLTSTGERLNQRQINSRLSREKKGFIERYVCESCDISSRRIVHWSHTISQKRCKELHKTELIWDEGNGSWDCQEHCHIEWESYKSGVFQEHFNMVRRMAFIAQHDLEGFKKRLNYITDQDIYKELLNFLPNE